MASRDLPEDIKVEILARLPVKSLMRFKRLSKPISALIKSAYFINKHFKFSSELARNKHALLIIRHHSPYPSPRLILISDEKFDAAPVDLQSTMFGSNVLAHSDVYGPCNGVFCINRLGQLFLWNPAIRETKLLPFRHCPELGFYVRFGFGIDTETNDYKIVSISADIMKSFNNINEQPPPLVELYNLSSNSWKIIESTVSVTDLDIPKYSLYFNGVYHWRSYSINGNNAIICFDMSMEVFWRMEIPGIENDHREWHVAVVDDFVACIKGPSETDLSIEIWIMNEYGVEESWTLLYKLADDFNLYEGLWIENSCIDGGLRWLASRYPLTQENEQHVLIYASIMFQAFRYAESLFPLSVLE